MFFQIYIAISLTTIAYYADKKKRTSQSESGEDEDPNLKHYPCKFCKQTFLMSQALGALGGHMNRHREGKPNLFSFLLY